MGAKTARTGASAVMPPQRPKLPTPEKRVSRIQEAALRLTCARPLPHPAALAYAPALAWWGSEPLGQHGLGSFVAARPLHCLSAQGEARRNEAQLPKWPGSTGCRTATARHLQRVLPELACVNPVAHLAPQGPFFPAHHKVNPCLPSQRSLNLPALPCFRTPCSRRVLSRGLLLPATRLATGSKDRLDARPTEAAGPAVQVGSAAEQFDEFRKQNKRDPYLDAGKLYAVDGALESGNVEKQAAFGKVAYAGELAVRRGPSCGT